MIALRLFDSAYQVLKRYSGLDKPSIDAWSASLLDINDMRRRCAEHDRWMRAHPKAAAFSEAWADRNLGTLAKH
ncbi:hypothetical protein [Mycobacterium riyadhense]|uniref:Uncharacterized protein n=1 Tax=Mycobacterium riyadhense TaxID=486698 RepID=A0A1X2CET9_9MYCO|nr:hypothetical protein [Mycobacterium riyadhense]ORW74372.1 hypothetical protein AWC22_23265 [Mycobacterium riyadhense]VTO98148.1 hypothetical protein BIN_B_02400 [Mycobacterium riyadhense]